MRTLDELERAAYIEDDKSFLKALAATEEVELDLDYKVRDLKDQLKSEVARADEYRSEREDLYEMLEEISFALTSRSEGLSQEQTQALSDLIALWQERVPFQLRDESQFIADLKRIL